MDRVSLTLGAEDDLREIWQYTCENWGASQADKYFDEIVACCAAIGYGSALSKPIAGLPANIRVHRCKEHYIFFQLAQEPIILAVLHGRMDFLRHLAPRL